LVAKRAKRLNLTGRTIKGKSRNLRAERSNIHSQKASFNQKLFDQYLKGTILKSRENSYTTQAISKFEQTTGSGFLKDFPQSYLLGEVSEEKSAANFEIGQFSPD
jgi:hypothetical protein